MEAKRWILGIMVIWRYPEESSKNVVESSRLAIAVPSLLTGFISIYDSRLRFTYLKPITFFPVLCIHFKLEKDECSVVLDVFTTPPPKYLAMFQRKIRVMSLSCICP
jgi:hypothetical protein